ncbi:MAG: hypothetical protein ABF242_10080 [Flavobacteriales bacterium]
MNIKLFAVLAIFLASCTLTAEPEFVKLDEFKLISVTKKNLTLGTKAFFFNPNDVGCEVVSTAIDVYINEIKTGAVGQEKIALVASGKDFFVPLTVSIPMEKIAKNKGGILGGLLKTLLNKNIAVKYDGIITLKKAGITFDIEIEGEEILKEFKKL